MEFLAILLALFLLQYWTLARPLHHDQWFMDLYHAIGKVSLFKRSAIVHLVLTILWPCAAVAGAYFFADDRFLGLVKLSLFVFCLLFSLGRGNYDETIEEYLQGWQSQEELLALQNLTDNLLPVKEDISHLHTMHIMARSVVFYRGFERFFAVIFWFMLAGPVAAVFYRLVNIHFYQLYDKQEDGHRIGRLLYLLEWLPGRLLGLSFSLVGDFVNGLQSCRKTLSDLSLGSVQVVNRNGISSLGFEEYWFGADNGGQEEFESAKEARQFIKQASEEIRDIRAIVGRAVVLWVVGLAFIQLLV